MGINSAFKGLILRALIQILGKSVSLIYSICQISWDWMCFAGKKLYLKQIGNKSIIMKYMNLNLSVNHLLLLFFF
jgi:hypothetical protein